MQEYCCRIKSAETPRPASTSHAYSQSHSLWMAELPDIFIDISNGRVTWHFSRYKSLTYIYNWFTNYGVFVYTIYRIYRTLFISINLSPANLSFFYRTIKPAKRNTGWAGAEDIAPVHVYFWNVKTQKFRKKNILY